MVSVTKNYNGALTNISISPDGAKTYVSVQWTDPSAPAQEGRQPCAVSVTNVCIAGNKITANNEAVGDAPVAYGVASTAYANLIRPLIEGLMTSGKIAP